MNRKILIVEDQFVEANYLSTMLIKAGYEVCGIARTVPKALELIRKENPDLVLVDIFLSGPDTGIDLARKLREDHIAFIFLSANSNEEILTAAKATQPYGFIVKPFREKDLLVSLEIARFRFEHSTDAAMKRECIIQNQLIEIARDNSSPELKVLNMGRLVQSDIPFDFMTIQMNERTPLSSFPVAFHRTGFDEYQLISPEALSNISGISRKKILDDLKPMEQMSSPEFFNGRDFEERCVVNFTERLFSEYFDLHAQLVLPMLLTDGRFCNFCFYSRRSDLYNTGHIALFHRIQKVWTGGMQSMYDRHSFEALANQHSPVSDAATIQAFPGFDQIIGRSHLLLNVFDLITQVSSQNTSVLILGESGTGKEKIASCIHRLSPRKSAPYIKINCAALPQNLIESELFGHEKGSFTGATERRIGKFEQADGGTVFLDEIGELGTDMQVKLLRVLQEKEIERIGSGTVRKVNVRIIAATNRNLEKEVAEGRFRLDLYYRLNVFPIMLPALRDRRDDIPLLAAYFLSVFNVKSGRKLIGFSDKMMHTMKNYAWPGNIRELENLVERSVLITKGNIIENMDFLFVVNKKEVLKSMQEKVKTINENERDHIISVLKQCNGKIWGAGAAAELLNIPPSTLKSKMQKLNIRKNFASAETIRIPDEQSSSK